MKNLEIEAKMQVLAPAHEIFEAIVDPAKMAHYFISQSTGRMEEGKTLQWKFPEFEALSPVKVDKVEKDQYVSYYWGEEGKELLVEITLTTRDVNKTLVTVTEKSMPNNEAGLKWLSGNTFGWSNFLACLKAYVEYGINLRKGAFDFMNDKK